MDSASVSPSLLQDLTNAHHHSYQLGRQILSEEIQHLIRVALTEPTINPGEVLVNVVKYCQQESLR